MKRDVAAELEVAITAPTTLEFQIAVASNGLPCRRRGLRRRALASGDIAFLDNHKGAITLNGLAVKAISDGDLPEDPIGQLVSIG